jgi:hypothetical protein
MPCPPFLFSAMKVTVVAGAALTVVLILAGCAGGQDGRATPERVSPEYEQTAGVLIVEADTYGGLMPPPSSRHVAELSVFGDGLVVLGEDDGAPRVGTDRRVTTGHIDHEELQELLAFIAESGFFGLDDLHAPFPAPPDSPARHVTINLLAATKTVSVFPQYYEDAPAAFRETYEKLMEISPPDLTPFIPSAGTLTATDLGPIEDLPAGHGNQVAPWDTPLVGIALSAVTGGVHLEGEQYQVVEGFLLRYPRGQLFGSQEGIAYRVLLEADLPWEAGSS